MGCQLSDLDPVIPINDKFIDEKNAGKCTGYIVPPRKNSKILQLKGKKKLELHLFSTFISRNWNVGDSETVHCFLILRYNMIYRGGKVVFYIIFLV